MPIQAEGAVPERVGPRHARRGRAGKISAVLLALTLCGLAITFCGSADVWPVGNYAFAGPRAGFSGDERPGWYFRIWKSGGFEVYRWKADASIGPRVVIRTDRAQISVTPGAGSRERPD